MGTLIHLVLLLRLFQKNLAINTRLRKQVVLVTFKSKGVLISDGKCVGGEGRLTDEVQ